MSTKPKMRRSFSTSPFVTRSNLDTFADGTCTARLLRVGQWVQLSWLDQKSRFIGRTRSGVLVMDHELSGNKEFSAKVKVFKETQKRRNAKKRKK